MSGFAAWSSLESRPHALFQTIQVSGNGTQLCSAQTLGERLPRLASRIANSPYLARGLAVGRQFSLPVPRGAPIHIPASLPTRRNHLPLARLQPPQGIH